MTHKSFNQRYIVVFVIIAVIAVVFLSLKGGNLQGAPVFVSEKLRVQSCLDTDSANDRFAKGHAQVGISRYYDYCRGDKVYQYECKTSIRAELTAHPAPCEKGCSNGACVK